MKKNKRYYQYCNNFIITILMAKIKLTVKQMQYLPQAMKDLIKQINNWSVQLDYSNEEHQKLIKMINKL